MALRSARERVLQTLCFEGGGLVLVVPAYALIMGRSGSESLLLMAMLSVIVMIWSPIHNTVFDLIDLHMTGRLASDRPHRLRLVHALSHEATAVIMTLPVLVWLGGHSFWGALAVDFTLTIAYSIYAYFFHLAYDRLRPVSGKRVRVNDTPPPSPENASTVSGPAPDSWT
ncbi:MAG: PACE efflux transporter [Paracoccaceae bacterium]